MRSHSSNYFWTLVLLLFSSQVFATNHKVTVNSDSATFTYVVGVTTLFNLVTDGSSGSSASAPLNTYIPVSVKANSTPTGDCSATTAELEDQKNHHVSSNFASITGIVNSTNLNINLSVDFDSSDEADTDKLMVAVQKKDTTNEYIITQISSSEITGDINTAISIDLGELCQANAELDCTLFDNTTDADNEDEVLVYIFSGDSTTESVGNEIDVDSETNVQEGLFVKVFFSSKVDDISTGDPTINSVTKGDSRLSVNYSGTVPDDFHHVRFIQKKGSSTCSRGSTIQDYPGAGFEILATENPATSDATITINELTNGIEHNFGVAFVNKFGFATTVSNIDGDTPLDILEILEENSCFFLTAGFQGDHYVVTYFRNFRDQVLLKNSLGEKIVEFYYSSAPKYALDIYNSDLLARSIRGMAYTLYFVFNNIYLIIAIFLGSGYLLVRKKYKKV